MPDDFLTLSARKLHPGNTADNPAPSQDSAARLRAAPLPQSVSPPLAMIDADPEGKSASTIALCVHAELAAVEGEWKSFEQRADCTVFQSFDFLSAWQRHIGTRSGTVPAIVIGRDPEGLLFILQLAIERRGLARRLTWLGSGLCDYNAPLLDERFSRQVDAARFAGLWQEVCKLLQADPRFRFDCIDLQKMPATVGTQANPFVHLSVLAHPSGAYVTDLAGDWDTFYAAKRSASTRKKERRQRKQLADYGEVRFLDVRQVAERERTLATLLQQKSESFARMGVENIFARPGYREFLHDIVTAPNLHELTHMSRLDIGATIAAANLGLRFRDCYYLVVSSYHDGEFTRFGPGRAHLNELLRHAIERGFRRFDFTVGDEPYKRDWCDDELRLYDHLAAVTLRGRMVVATSSAFRRLKRVIKQTPALWRIFSKARELAGSMARR